MNLRFLSMLLFLAVAGGLSIARPAHADPIGAEAPAQTDLEALASSKAAPEPEKTTQPEWYGYQTLAADGAAVVMTAGALVSDSPTNTLAYAALGTYLLGAPIVHFAHKRVGMGFADFGIRAGAPIVLGILGGFAGALLSSQLSGVVEGAGAGLVTGVLTASTLDAALFAQEAPARSADSTPKPAATGFRLAPVFGVGREGPSGTHATAGVVGVF
jgi:hypothetical protein